MEFTKEQIFDLTSKHLEKENGIQDLLEIMLESIMLAERREFLSSSPGNKGNGYRPGRTLTFRIPRDRYGNFHPAILAVIRSQEDECERLAGRSTAAA